ncbi:hypothetical protein KKF84_22470, partial [Myxococcota bacterium]|nr:hypothetical protein [Myxococcota bacterium]
KKVITPGEKITVDLKVTDLKGKPVASRLTVMVVDEGVISLLGYQTPNSINYFHPYNGAGTSLMDIRHFILNKLKKRPAVIARNMPKKPNSPVAQTRTLDRYSGAKDKRGMLNSVSKVARAEVAADEVAALPMGGAVAGKGGMSGEARVFKVRKFFATTAYYNSKVVTDAQGKATLTIPMPENLTAFRIMAVAMEQNAKDRYGNGEERVKIRRKFMLRPSLPRFANYGDTFVASVVVNNQTGAKGTATVKIDGVGFELLDKNEKTAEVTNGESVEVGFTIRTMRPGRIRLRFVGYMGNQTDAVTPPPIPVHIPASSEASATYGVTEKSILQPVKLPKNAMPIFGGLDIHISSTALTGLQDAVRFIVDYHHECTEQIASRLVPIFSLKKILDEFKLGKISDREKRDAIAASGIARLLSTQQWDGGFTYWPGSYRSWPHISAYVTWTLIRARANGFTVPPRSLAKAAQYLYNFSASTYRWNYAGWYYAYTTRIMALWVLTQMLNEKDVSKYVRSKSNLLRYGKDLYDKRNKVGTFAKAWLMAVLFRLEGQSDRVKELGREISNTAVETAGAVHFAEATSEDIKLIMHSNSSSDSIVMRSLMEVDPTSTIIPKIVRGLMASRIKGTWETTLSNAWALDAVAQYFNQYEKDVPDFTANVWYGKGFVGSKVYRGRSMALTHKRIPMEWLVKQGDADFIMAKKGVGKLYYRLGMTYVPKNLKIKPAERGFVVKRVYEPVRDKSTVVKVKPGHWRIKAGSYVRVRLTVVAPDRRYYVAVDDPMPAGFEGVDMTLKTTASSSLSAGTSSYTSFWSWYWYRSPDFKDMRDDRYVLYWDRLPAGSYEHSYLVRATTIGTFNVPPLKAQEMYAPEVFGRNGSEVVEVVK